MSEDPPNDALVDLQKTGRSVRVGLLDFFETSSHLWVTEPLDKPQWIIWRCACKSPLMNTPTWRLLFRTPTGTYEVMSHASCVTNIDAVAAEFTRSMRFQRKYALVPLGVEPPDDGLEEEERCYGRRKR